MSTDRNHSHTGINRNIVECKELYLNSIFKLYRCINRNIVECKVISPEMLSGRDLCINRNIVECKVICAASIAVSSVVLIET